MNHVTELEQERDYKVHDVYRAVWLNDYLNCALTLRTKTTKSLQHNKDRGLFQSRAAIHQ